MIYFALIMASTLWISSVFGNDRLAIGVVLIVAFLAPIVLRRLRRGSPRVSAPRTTPVRVPTATPLAEPSAARLPRKRATHTGRRRRSRGVHR